MSCVSVAVFMVLGRSHAVIVLSAHTCLVQVTLHDSLAEWSKALA